MIDRSIPYYNLILKCTKICTTPVSLPKGYSFKIYDVGDEKHWAKLEYQIGDFSSVEEAEMYFKTNYCNQIDELKKRCIFVVDTYGDIVGSCIAWHDLKGNDVVASLHWLVVSPEHQGKHIGFALCQKVMDIFNERCETPVYIHTQPWSYKAILLYIKLGFKIQKTDTFSHYKNQYKKAIKTLEKLLSESQFNQIILSSSKTFGDTKMHIVRKLKTTELSLLTQLFNYKNVDEMIAENTRDIETGIIDIFALFDGDKIIGELRVKYISDDNRFAEKGKRAYLYAFRVHKKYQGKGLGNFLLENVLTILTENGYSEFTVGVEDDNARAHYMYEKHGFTESVARIKESYQGDSYEYDLLLKKKLMEINNMDIFNKICLQLDLGEMTSEPLKLKGGFMHKMYSLFTTKGKYAIKLLNPYVMKRDTVFENYRIAEELESKLEQTDIPILPALTFNGKKMQGIDGQYYYLFDFYEGKSLKGEENTIEHCRKIGEFLAKIHNIEKKAQPYNRSEINVDWDMLIEKLSENNTELYKLLNANRDILYDSQQKGNLAVKKMPHILTICHNDMDSKNVLWNGADYRIIDLECLCYSSPFVELYEMALCWSGYENCNINFELFKTLIKSYADNGGELPDDWETIYYSSYGRLEWLEYNVKRALGIDCGEDEFEMGISEVRETMEHIVYYYGVRDEILECLNNL